MTVIILKDDDKKELKISIYYIKIIIFRIIINYYLICNICDYSYKNNCNINFYKCLKNIKNKIDSKNNENENQLKIKYCQINLIYYNEQIEDLFNIILNI